MIDEKKLIMHLADWQLSLLPEIDENDKEVYNILEDVIKAVEEQPKLADDWILVSDDRKPELHEVVMVTAYNSNTKEYEVNEYMYDGSFVYFCDYLEVIAWQPMYIPEPYISESKKYALLGEDFAKGFSDAIKKASEALKNWRLKNFKMQSSLMAEDVGKWLGTELKGLETKVKYIRDISPIEKIEVGNWMDLRAGEDVTLKAGQYYNIPLGVAMELPKGYEAIVAPRSSTFKKYGILMANSIGIIDESYCGDSDEWQLVAYATRDTVINKNERICQFRIFNHQPALELVTVEMLGNADRGGIGSTGTV